MADFCMRCNLDMYFGPNSDFAHFGESGDITAEDVAKGMGMPVLCEGCGFIYVDHLGRCLGGCDLSHMPPGDDEVLRRASRWVAARSGPWGWFLRLRDRHLGTPWEPGAIHFPGTWQWYVREFWSALYEGRQMMRVADYDEFNFGTYTSVITAIDDEGNRIDVI